MTRPWEGGAKTLEDRATDPFSKRRSRRSRIQADHDARIVHCPRCRVGRHAPCVTIGARVPTHTHEVRIGRWREVVRRIRCGGCQSDQHKYRGVGTTIVLRECPTSNRRGHIHWICTSCAVGMFGSGAYDRTLTLCPFLPAGQKMIEAHVAMMSMRALGEMR